MSMRFTRMGAFALASALLVGGAAKAEPIHVEYLVDQKAFKKGATATDTLSFDLYSDDQCTAPIGSTQYFVGDASINYFVDKRHKVKGGIALPKAVRILAVIDGPVSDAAPYLKVEGPGIAAIGEECQIQPGDAVAGSGPSGPQGEAGPEGPQGPAGADGAQGPQGLAGLDGAQGEAGPQGPAGADGAQGPAGADGAQGPAGADGAQGPQGEAGPQGPAGADGAQGPAGADGAQGPQGLAGRWAPMVRRVRRVAARWRAGSRWR